MRALVATWPRRVSLAFAVLLLASVVGLLRLWSASSVGTAEPGTEHIMLRLVVLPALLAITSLLVFTALARPRSSPTVSAPAPFAPALQPKPFTAGVMGLQWLNPLQRSDYPTQWQLLWTLGVSGPNAGDDLLAHDPERYGQPQVLDAVIDGKGAEPLDLFTRYFDKLLDQLKGAYVGDARAFYNVCAEDRQQRRELSGVHVVCALPESFDAEEAGDVVRARIAAAFGLGAAAGPSVRVVQGGAAAGLTALASALDYLRNYPDGTAWVLGWDAPDAGGEPQINENIVLLVLGGPELITDREPLASLGYPAESSSNDFEAKKDALPRAVQAMVKAFRQAASQAARPEFDARFIIHNTGTESETLGHLAEGLTTELAEFNFVKQSFNAGTFFGAAGACGTLVNIALAVAHAHHQGSPALVADTSTPDKPRALVVAPPLHPLVLEPGKPWFRARSEFHAHLPWWSRPRHSSQTAILGMPT